MNPLTPDGLITDAIIGIDFTESDKHFRFVRVLTWLLVLHVIIKFPFLIGLNDLYWPIDLRKHLPRVKRAEAARGLLLDPKSVSHLTKKAATTQLLPIILQDLKITFTLKNLKSKYTF